MTQPSPGRQRSLNPAPDRKVLDWAQAIGVASEDGERRRIPVRKQEDVILSPPWWLYLPLMPKTAAP